MRISDWSSDVCSSDLPHPLACRRRCSGSSGPAICRSSGQRWLGSFSLRCAGRRVPPSRHHCSSLIATAASGAHQRPSSVSLARRASHSAPPRKVTSQHLPLGPPPHAPAQLTPPPSPPHHHPTPPNTTPPTP